MEDDKSGTMSAPLRLLLSVIGVGAMYALGRVVRSQLTKRVGSGAAKAASGRPKLRALPSPVVAEEVVETPAEEVDPNRVMIYVPPAAVYEHARKLEYIDGLLIGIGLEVSVIIDQPGEFFGIRVEHEGEMYGTALVHFEEIPGKKGGTEVSVNVKYKHDFGVYSKAAIEAGVNKEVALYLHHLKEECEKNKQAADLV